MLIDSSLTLHPKSDCPLIAEEMELGTTDLLSFRFLHMPKQCAWGCGPSDAAYALCESGKLDRGRALSK